MSSASILELATPGRVALGARTPREALSRIAAVLPHHCTHEHITLTRTSGGTVVRELLALPLDAETLHVSQQYIAALIRTICDMADAQGPVPIRIEIVPHPQAGLAHLGRWLGPNLVAATTPALIVTIRDAVLDKPFPVRARDHAAGLPPAGWHQLRGDGSLAGSARVILTTMLGEGAPTVDQLAAAAGTSVRTLQRRLGQEGTNFFRPARGRPANHGAAGAVRPRPLGRRDRGDAGLRAPGLADPRRAPVDRQAAARAAAPRAGEQPTLAGCCCRVGCSTAGMLHRRRISRCRGTSDVARAEKNGCSPSLYCLCGVGTDWGIGPGVDASPPVNRRGADTVCATI